MSTPIEEKETVNPTRVDGGITETSVSITITFYPERGNVEVKGPVGNPILFLGMLKLAEKTYDALRLRQQLDAAKSTPRIHTV